MFIKVFVTCVYIEFAIFSGNKSSVFWHMLAGCLDNPCSYSVEKYYPSVVLGTNYLPFEDGIVEASIGLYFAESSTCKLCI